MSNVTDDRNLFVRHKCAKCGMVFYSEHQYRYKRYVVDRTKYFCCRECMDKYTGYKGSDSDGSKTVVKEEDKEVIKNLYFESGWSMEEISDHLGYTFKTIESYCLQLIDEYPL